MRLLRGAVLTLLSAGVLAAAAPATPATTQPAVKGRRVFVCGHSFHVFIARPLAELARAAGIEGHVNVGVQFIGASSVTRHWNVPDDRNRAKQAAASGRIDVLTLSHAWLNPDPAIEKFVDLAVRNNPDVRVVVQQSWCAWDGTDPPYRIKDNAERDGKTVEQLRVPLAELNRKLNGQVRAVNEKVGRPVLFVAPAGDAILLLREKVIAGEAPGVKKQSELFRDALGHGREAIQRLVTYVNFAVIYRRSPVGLKVFEKPGNDDWNRLNRLLQELAWQAVRAQPLTGVTPPAAPGQTTAVPGRPETKGP